MKIKRGDIFTIPIDGDHVGYGQVVAARKHDFLIVVYEGRYKKMKL